MRQKAMKFKVPNVNNVRRSYSRYVTHHNSKMHGQSQNWI